LAHPFVTVPRNTESIPSSPRLVLGQKPGDLRDPDDASVNKEAKDAFQLAEEVVAAMGSCIERERICRERRVTAKIHFDGRLA
jgi:hypothetical protein